MELPSSCQNLLRGITLSNYIKCKLFYTSFKPSPTYTMVTSPEHQLTLQVLDVKYVHNKLTAASRLQTLQRFRKCPM